MICRIELPMRWREREKRTGTDKTFAMLGFEAWELLSAPKKAFKYTCVRVAVSFPACILCMVLD